MRLKKEFSDLRLSFGPLTFYQKFEHICIMVLIALIAIIIVLAMWNLTLKILLSVLSTNFDPTDYGVFQAVFGAIFTVIIALEFKRSLLVLAERSDSVVQVRAVVLIALLAVARKLIILDLSSTDAFHILALAAAVLALGAVYWLVATRAGGASVFGLNCAMSLAHSGRANAPHMSARGRADIVAKWPHPRRTRLLNPNCF